MNIWQQQSPLLTFLRKFLVQRLALFAFFILVFILSVALFAPWIAPYDPSRPVNVQYADKGIDVSQLTRHSPEVSGVLSNGERVDYAELPRITVDSDNPRVVSARRTRSGINVVALTSGTSPVYFTTDGLGVAVSVFVTGDARLENTTEHVLQVLPERYLFEVGSGEQLQLNAQVRLDTGEVLDANVFGSELTIDYTSLDQGITEVSRSGLVRFLQPGEGLVKLQVGNVSSLVQFSVDGANVQPRLVQLELAQYQVKLTDAYKHQRPSSLHWFGTDHQNRDIFSRVVLGTRDTLLIGFLSVAIGTVIGTVLGLLAGFYGGRLDNIITRVMDVLLAFPGILLAIAVIAFLGAGLINIIFAVAVFTVPVFVRIVRASALSLKEMTYVEAARSIGVKDTVIIARHIFPGTLPVILVYLTMRIGVAILIGAALSFLGLGGDITAPEWGSMLSAAKDNSSTVFHATFFPGLAIVITVLCFNIFGDGLRDALDPKLKE